MIKRTFLPALAILSIILAGCASPSSINQPTTIPTQVPATQTPQPTNTSVSPSPTPIIASPTATPPENPIQHFPAGQEFTITSIHMIDATRGWGIGGLAGVGDHVLYTTDGGSTWKDVTPPEEEAVSGERKIAIGYFQDANTSWVTYAINTGNPVPTQAVVWRTSDGGASWQTSQPLDLSGLSEIYYPSDLQIISGQSGWLLVHVGVGMNHDYVVLYRTSDGGVSWSRILDPYNDGGIQSCTKTAMLFTDATHGWLTGDCNGVKAGVELFNTTDAGSTWQEVTLPAPSSAPTLFSDMNVACGSYDPFFFGNDLGHLSVRCSNFSSTQITYSYYIYTTQNGGGTWTAASYPGNALYFFSADTGWALANKIQLTSDGGKTWTPISDVTWTPQMNFISEEIGWAVATVGQEVALVKTDNGGAKWTILIPTIGP